MTSRIAILGAESSGKSTLACALAQRYGVPWVPEYLREFVAVEQRVPLEQEQMLIATIQFEQENAAAAQGHPFLFCDTSALMTAIYSELYFQRVDPRLAALVQAQRYDLTLVTAPDSPWVADGLQRESEQVRSLIHQRLLAELVRRGLPFHLIAGTLEQRVAQVEELLAF